MPEHADTRHRDAVLMRRRNFSHSIMRDLDPMRKIEIAGGPSRSLCN
jgi:hypothetical protein